MPDVNAFIEAIGKDVSAAIVPRLEELARTVGERARTEYGPRISAFADQLLKDVIDQQSAAVRDFVIALIQELAQRYRPELSGELHTRLVQGGLELTGQAVRLDILGRDSGSPVSSLDIPISVRIKLDALAVNLQNTTIKLDVLT
jgi:hypothetical protein